MTKTDAGYEGVAPEDKPELGHIEYRLERYDQLHAVVGFYCRFMRGEESVGVIRLEHEDEFEFLKKRIASTFTRMD